MQECEGPAGHFARRSRTVLEDPMEFVCHANRSWEKTPEATGHSWKMLKDYSCVNWVLEEFFYFSLASTSLAKLPQLASLDTTEEFKEN